MLFGRLSINMISIEDNNNIIMTEMILYDIKVEHMLTVVGINR